MTRSGASVVHTAHTLKAAQHAFDTADPNLSKQAHAARARSFSEDGGDLQEDGHGHADTLKMRFLGALEAGYLLCFLLLVFFANLTVAGADSLCPWMPAEVVVWLQAAAVALGGMVSAVRHVLGRRSYRLAYARERKREQWELRNYPEGREWIRLTMRRRASN